MVYVNRFTDPLPHYCGPKEGEEGEGGGRVEKNRGGGKIGRRGNEENSARAAPKKGGGERDKGWGIQVYNAYHFKRNEKYSDPLNSSKLFLWFCFS